MEQEFLDQGDVRRSLADTSEIGWRLLAELPDEALVRLSDAQIAQRLSEYRNGG